MCRNTYIERVLGGFPLHLLDYNIIAPGIVYIKYTHQCQTQPPSNTARRKCKSGAGIYAAAATAAIRPNSTPKPPPPRLFTCHLQRRKHTIRTCLGCLTHIHVMKVHISPNTLDRVTGSVLCERFLVRLH